ncbi:DUF1318 domain-containing protein [Dethiosulfatarculus sandiegensis]|uniref:DUF1318 domain-containing protein n=1 Tax=Dethiosulfatarculus sandiegensis TaxID=1429043 RepID=A0A0D2JTM4_9BACT|nr:DUF1318 domain-containing protein [Dethiosulfatarculus sandiegensis]KIX12855.1 hypothetical protein X474_17425 [Dethiosulfatarculus sandiegensis]
MRQILRSRSLIVMGMMLLASACVTVNIYFPAAKVEKLADEIVDEVYKGDEKQKPAPKKEQTSSLLRQVLAFLAPREAHAASATTVSNASIRALKSKIAGNHQKLAKYYNQGNVGITKDGMLAVRDTKGLNMRDVANLKRLVNADNMARNALYKEVAKALNIKPNQIGKIQGIFADQWRNKARGGWWIQENSGKWRRK